MGGVSGVHHLLLHYTAHNFMKEMSGTKQKSYTGVISSNLLHLLKILGTEELEGST